MANKAKNNKINKNLSITSITNTVANTIGLSVITTATAVGVHHIWRKRKYPNAKVLDYIAGTATQWQRVQYANKNALKAWQQGYFAKVADTVVDTDDHITPSTRASKVKPTPAAGTLPVTWVSGVADMSKGQGGELDDFSVVGIDKNRQIVWRTTLPERVHDIVVQPPPPNLPLIKGRNQFIQNRKRDVAVMGRRPSEHFWIMDCATGKLIHTIKAKVNRHFYGHACYSLDGSLLYVTENDTATYDGRIGVYDAANGYKKVNEFASHGIGPHEVILHPDGDKLVIANGGIKTDRASREELNLDSMKPSLVYMSLDGKLLQQVEPEHNQMSVRHISVINAGSLKGTVAIGIQFQGEKHLNMPLVLTHKFGNDAFSEYTPATDWRQFHHYIASIMVNTNSNLICATSPIGGCVSVFDMTTQTMIKTVKIADCAGIAVADDGFMISDGQGGLTLLTVKNGKLVTTLDTDFDKDIDLEFDMVTTKQMMAFDNHMQQVV